MPFKSKKQQRWMYANKPEMAEKWSKETDFSKLPEKVKRKKKQTGGVYKSQAEIDQANAFAVNFSKRRHFGQGINPEQTTIGRNVGDPIVPFVDARTGKPLPAAVPTRKAMTVPDDLKLDDIQSQDGQYWYTDPHTGDLVDVDSSVINLPRFRRPQLTASRQMGGINDIASFRGQAPQQTSMSYLAGFTGMAPQQSVINPQQAQIDAEEEKKKKKWNPYFMLRGATTGLSLMSGILERGRQNQYMMDQMSTLGQLDPMQVQDYQPTPYQQYAQKGGEVEEALRSAKNLKTSKNGNFKGLIPFENWTEDLLNYADKVKFVQRNGEQYIKVRGNLKRGVPKKVIEDALKSNNG